jgi:cation diffusion facilitator CzcD-associated flavoprotein CzcO
VVLERGRVGERWRSERWDSLRLLSPNWHTRLPGFRYDGPNPTATCASASSSGCSSATRGRSALRSSEQTKVLAVERAAPATA